MADRVDPYRSYRFRVDLSGTASASAFSEVTVPETTVDNVEYREGTDPTHVRQLSGLTKYGNITLKRGVTDSMDLTTWFKTITDKGAEGNRQNLTITLIDEAGADKTAWNVTNAWPTKLETGGFNATGNEVLIETLELVHEGIERQK